MKTVKNLTRKPLRVPLPQGKVLHLGPLQSGRIAHQDADHPPLQKLVADETLAILGAAEAAHEGPRGSAMPHEETHGHHPAPVKKRGDR